MPSSNLFSSSSPAPSSSSNKPPPDPPSPSSDFCIYAAIYTIWKHKTLYGTAIGSIAGAIPPVIGYSAVTNQLDLAALLLFLIVVFWQMPHFFAIAMYRFDDYAAASIPVFPVVRGMHAAKIRILSYIVAFTLSSSMLTLSGYVGYAYLTVTSLLVLGGSGWPSKASKHERYPLGP